MAQMKTQKKQFSLEYCALTALGALLPLAAKAAPMTAPIPDKFNTYIGETVTYDNNLYRLPANLSDAELGLTEDRARTDVIYCTSAGGEGHLFAGRQSFDLNARLDDYHYVHNDILNNTGGQGNGTWNWRIGHDWSGRAGVEYQRVLAGFTNSRSLQKDVVTRTNYLFETADQLTPRWALTGSVNQTQSKHSADVHTGDNLRSKTIEGGLRYQTPLKNSFGVNYRYNDSVFPDRANTSALDEDYREREANVWIKYMLSGKTSIDARTGYLRRNYTGSAFNDLSGGTWRAAILWQTTAKTQIQVSVWKELQAYLEADSDYFVGRGVSVAPTWEYSDALAFSLLFSHEKQDYIGVDSAPGIDQRRDTVDARQLIATYTPAHWMEASLNYRFEERNSNRDTQAYDDDIISLHIKFIF